MRSASLRLRLPVRIVRPLALTAMLAAAGLVTSSASAAGGAPGWVIRSVASPTSFSGGASAGCSQEGLCDGYFVTATNVGTMSSSHRIVITDVLPAGTEVVNVPGRGARAYEPNNSNGTGENLSCSWTASRVICEDEGAVVPDGVLTVHIELQVTGDESVLAANHVEVKEEEAGGTPAAQAEEQGLPTPVGGGPAGFGVQDFSVGTFGPAGDRDLQAGSHPATVATTIAYNTVLDTQGFLSNLPWDAAAEPRVENVDLPMGFVGDALAAPRCSAASLAAETCPPHTRVGGIGAYKTEATKDQF